MKLRQFDLRPKILRLQSNCLVIPMQRVHDRTSGSQGGFLPRRAGGLSFELLDFVVYPSGRRRLPVERVLKRVFGSSNVAFSQRFLCLGFGRIVRKQNLLRSGYGAFYCVFGNVHTALFRFFGLSGEHVSEQFFGFLFSP